MPWTEERRQKQREVINRCKPWLKSTGPKSPKGKIIASRNARKHGRRAQEYKIMRRALRLNKQFTDAIMLYKVHDLLEKARTNELLKDHLESILIPPAPGKNGKRTIKIKSAEAILNSLVWQTKHDPRNRNQ